LLLLFLFFAFFYSILGLRLKIFKNAKENN
jgi:hypothetical protein